MAPAIAGFVVFLYGFKALFVLAGIIYLISAIPLFYLPEFPFNDKFSFGTFVKLVRKYPHYLVAEIFENVREDAEGIIWPVVVYLNFRDVLSIGYIGTISGVGSILFVLLVGKYTDRINKQKLLAAGAFIMALIWVSRYYVSTPLPSYALTLVASFFAALILIPINSIVYGVAKREGAANFILFREFAVTIGRLLLWLFAFLVISSVNYIFIFTALACLGLVYISRSNLEDGLKGE